MLLDWRGQEVTASGAATVAGIDGFIQSFLAYENGAAVVQEAANADPDCALANAYAGPPADLSQARAGLPAAGPARAGRARGRRQTDRHQGPWLSPDDPVV